MNEDQARAVLGKAVKDDNSLYNCGAYLSWMPGDRDVTLDGDFYLGYLKAVVWWMENKLEIES